MFVTGLRQMRFVWSMLPGRPQRVSDLVALVLDTDATLAKFGTPGAGASDLLTTPDLELQTDLASGRLRATIRRAAREIRYYRWWFEKNGLDPDTITPMTLYPRGDPLVGTGSATSLVPLLCSSGGGDGRPGI